MELNKDVPSNMHYCLYCIARGQIRKKSDYTYSSCGCEILNSKILNS